MNEELTADNVADEIAEMYGPLAAERFWQELTDSAELCDGFEEFLIDYQLNQDGDFFYAPLSSTSVLKH